MDTLLAACIYCTYTPNSLCFVRAILGSVLHAMQRSCNTETLELAKNVAYTMGT